LDAYSMGSPLTRVYLTRFVPSSGFLNLLTAYSSPYLVALFHATDACGVLPPELSPFKDWCCLSAVRALLSFQRRHLPSEEGRRVAKAAYRAFFPLKVRCALVRRLKLTCARCSPGLFPSRVLPLPAVEDASNLLPSCPWLTDRPRALRSPELQGLALRGAGWSPERLPTLLGFPTL
jgi:hypothetical protein